MCSSNVSYLNRWYICFAGADVKAVAVCSAVEYAEVYLISCCLTYATYFSNNMYTIQKIFIICVQLRFSLKKTN